MGEETVANKSDIEEDEDIKINDAIINRSSIRSTRIGSINKTDIKIVGEEKLTCPKCGNVVDKDNRRLVCEICGTKDFCENCESQMTKTRTYRGYELDLEWPLCKECYKGELDLAKLQINKGHTERFKKTGADRDFVDRGKVKRPEGMQKETGKDPDIIEQMDLKPVMDVGDQNRVGHWCGILSIVFGIASLFILGFIFGPTAIILGYMAKVRKNRKGIWGIVLGSLGIATSAFWAIFTGGFVWFL